MWSFSTLYNRVLDLKYSSPGASETTEAKAAVNEGIRLVLGAYPWSFMESHDTMTLWSTATGTAAVTTTAIADATNDPFYETMVGRVLVMDTSENEYTITAYTDAENITVDSDATSDDGDTFTITAYGYYGLPSDYSHHQQDPIITDDGYGQPRIQQRSPEQVKAMMEANDNNTGTPRFYAITPRTFAIATGQRYDMLVHRIPDTDYTVYFPHAKTFTDLSADANYPPGPEWMSLCYLHAALSMHDEMHGQVDGFHHKLFWGLVPGRAGYLDMAIKRDRLTGSRILGETPSRVQIIKRPHAVTYS